MSTPAGNLGTQESNVGDSRVSHFGAWALDFFFIIYLKKRESLKFLRPHLGNNQSVSIGKLAAYQIDACVNYS